jgi:hypothetical protein
MGADRSLYEWASGGAHADFVIKNGRVATLNHLQPFDRHLVVRDGLILCLSDDERQIARRFGPLTRVIDVGGRTVIPACTTAICILAQPPSIRNCQPCYGLLRRSVEPAKFATQDLSRAGLR